MLLFVLQTTPAGAADSYQVNYGATVAITEHSVTRCVSNNHASGLAIFVPTKTSTEWASFYNSPPAGVTAGTCTTCALPWGGSIGHGASVIAYSTATPTCTTSCAAVSQTRTCTNGVLSGNFTNQSCADSTSVAHGGSCWRYGALNQSCDTVCASSDGCNLTSTRDYAGSGGDNANCQAVLGALGATGANVINGTAAGVGCLYSNFHGSRVRMTTGTTCDATNAYYRRACACNR